MHGTHVGIELVGSLQKLERCILGEWNEDRRKGIILVFVELRACTSTGVNFVAQPMGYNHDGIPINGTAIV